MSYDPKINDLGDPVPWQMTVTATPEPTGNQQRAAAVWDVAAPEKGGYVVTRQRLEPVIAAALDVAEVRGRAVMAAKVAALADEIEAPGSEAAKYLAARIRRALDDER